MHRLAGARPIDDRAAFRLQAGDLEEARVKKGLATGGLTMRTIEELQSEVEWICGGKPQKPELTDRPVAVIKWVDGTVLDTVFQIAD